MRISITLAQPDCIPKRIVANPSYKPRPFWIEDDVAGDREQILIDANSVIMKSTRSNPSLDAAHIIDHTRRHAFDSTYQHGQLVLLAQFNQAMPMIRHQDPAKQT